MGGIGSGREYGWGSTETIEEVKRIDVRYLKKIGALVAGSYGSLSWTRRDKPSGSIQFKTHQNHIELDYNISIAGGDWQPVTQSVSFLRSPCNYGGYRVWLACNACNRRVGILCGAGKYFLCRHCYRLPYGSQTECSLGRLIRAKSKLARRAFDGDLHTRPKGMHKKTFERLRDQYWQLEEQAAWAIETKLNGGGVRF